MFLTICYCHRDSCQALRLLKWIAYLGGGHCDIGCLLVPNSIVSKQRVHYRITDLAAKIFTKAYCYLPDGSYERGWPHSPNRMFQTALNHIEKHFQEDMLWVEPDSVMVSPDWLDKIKGAWSNAQDYGKTFMGHYVHRTPPHMSGIGVYGKNWRSVAPSLITATSIPWDVHAAPEIIPNAHFWRGILHLHEPLNPVHECIQHMTEGMVLFHQDKRGLIMPFIDKTYFNGGAAAHPEYSYTQDESLRLMRKFYHTDNASKSVEALGQRFYFEPYDSFGGAWRGTYATEDETEQVVLETILADVRSGVTEITEPEFQAKAKKKAVTPNSKPYEDWKPPQAPIKQSPVGLVVENPLPSPNDALKQEVGLDKPSIIDDINDVLTLGKVEPHQPERIDIKPRKRPGKKGE